MKKSDFWFICICIMVLSLSSLARSTTCYVVADYHADHTCATAHIQKTTNLI